MAEKRTEISFTQKPLQVICPGYVKKEIRSVYIQTAMRYGNHLNKHITSIRV